MYADYANRLELEGLAVVLCIMHLVRALSSIDEEAATGQLSLTNQFQPTSLIEWLATIVIVEHTLINEKQHPVRARGGCGADWIEGSWRLQWQYSTV